jgi:ubiquinone/menaquinone biosynthesis C-methylase UbiE
MGDLNPDLWDRRYRQQAEWTRSLRMYLYERLGLEQAQGVLDLGCGTGALLSELTAQNGGELHGLDISADHLELARQSAPQAQLALGDAHHLPYAEGSFDLTLTHFVLLWLTDPTRALAEMRRVTKRGGYVAALAEPDYGGRIDYPDELSTLGDLQRESLRRQGADPLLGRKLRGMFHAAGLTEVESGILGAQWSGSLSAEEISLEWAVLREDVGEKKIDHLEVVDEEAWKQGKRVLFVPTFYAVGRV